MKPQSAFIRVSVLFMLWRSSSADHSVSVSHHDESERWRQSVAVRLTTRGPDRPYDVHRTRRDSSVTVTFKRAISNVLHSTARCSPSSEKRCTLAHNSPGLVGEMHYKFVDEDRKIRGHSTQVLLACRCLDEGCREAIVLQPRRVIPLKGREQVVCTYPRINGKWRDCHTELLRLKEIEVDDIHDIPKSKEFVVELGVNKFWRTVGRRRYVRDISRTEVGSLANMSFEQIIQKFKDRAKSTDEFYVFGNNTVGNLKLNDELVVESGDGEECGKLFDYAQRSADWMGAQQDQLAIGRNEDSFLLERPEEPSSPDAFLAIGTGLTGLLAAIGIRVYMRDGVIAHGKRGRRSRDTAWLVSKGALAVMVIGVEIAALVFTFVNQNTARKWRSLFTWFDASVALSPAVAQCETQKEFICSAAGSVYVVTGLMGTAMAFYANQTQWTLLLVCMVLIVGVTLVFVGVFLVKSYQWWMRRGEREADDGSQAAQVEMVSKREQLPHESRSGSPVASSSSAPGTDASNG